MTGTLPVWPLEDTAWTDGSPRKGGSAELRTIRRQQCTKCGPWHRGRSRMNSWLGLPYPPAYPGRTARRQAGRST